MRLTSCVPWTWMWPQTGWEMQFFFFFSPLLHTVCGVEGVDSCGTPDSSWESTNLWPPSQLPCCVFLERVEGIIWILYECGTHASISGEVILGEKMCSEMLFNLLWRIDVNQIFNYCMFGHIEKNLCILQDCVFVSTVDFAIVLCLCWTAGASSIRLCVSLC